MGNKVDKIKKLSKEHFDNQANTYYENGDGKFVMPMYKEVIKRIIDKNPRSILDVGCGTGDILLKILEWKDIEVCGVDISEKMVGVAKEKIKDKGDIRVGDSENIPWDDNTFDVVVCNASFHHYPNPKNVLLEMKRVLKSDGTLIIGDPTMPMILRQIMNTFCRFSNSGDYRIYGKKDIEALLIESGFKPYDFKKIDSKRFCVNGKLG